MRAAGSLGRVLDFLLPAACMGCGIRMVPEESGRLWCARCGARLRPPPAPGCPRCQAPRGTGASGLAPCRECSEWPPELVAAEGAVAMAPPADRLVHALKYEGWGVLAEPLGERMEPAARRLARRLGQHGDSGPEPAVVPIPTTRARRRSRGYNQAELLARSVARRLGLPLAHALERTEGGATQVTLHPAARRANVRRSFRWTGTSRGGGPASGRPAARGRGAERPAPDGWAGGALLVDDVLTTGATAEAAARALVAGGARRVAVLAFARALPDPAPGTDVPEDPEALGELLDPVLPGAWKRPGDAGGGREAGVPRRDRR